MTKTTPAIKFFLIISLILFSYSATYGQAQVFSRIDSNTRKPRLFIVTNKKDTISLDSIRNRRVSENDIQAYLNLRPKFGDTTGKRQSIIRLLKSVDWLMMTQCDGFSDAVAFAEESVRVSEKVNKVLVIKSTRKMYLLKDKDTVFTFSIALGRNPVGQKISEGDGKTPEGMYTFTGLNLQGSHWTLIKSVTPALQTSTGQSAKAL